MGTHIAKDNLPCIHMKIYDHAVQLHATPPQRHWICKLCGAQGMESAEEWEVEDSYNEVVKRFHGHD